jgi:hypothetical protein
VKGPRCTESGPQVVTVATKQKHFDLHRPAKGISRVPEDTHRLQKCSRNVAELLQIWHKTPSSCLVSVLLVLGGHGFAELLPVVSLQWLDTERFAFFRGCYCLFLVVHVNERDGGLENAFESLVNRSKYFFRIKCRNFHALVWTHIPQMWPALLRVNLRTYEHAETPLKL